MLDEAHGDELVSDRYPLYVRQGTCLPQVEVGIVGIHVMLHGFQFVVHVVLCPVVSPCLSGRLAFLFPAFQFLIVRQRFGYLLPGTVPHELGQSPGDTLLLVQRFAFLQQGFFQGSDFGCQFAYLLQQLHFALPSGVYLLLQQFYDFLVCHSVKIQKTDDTAKGNYNYFIIK